MAASVHHHHDGTGTAQYRHASGLYPVCLEDQRQDVGRRLFLLHVERHEEADGILFAEDDRRYLTKKRYQRDDRPDPGQRLCAVGAQRHHVSVLSCRHDPQVTDPYGDRYSDALTEPVGLQSDLRKARQYDAHTDARCRQPFFDYDQRHFDDRDDQGIRCRERLLPQVGRPSGFLECAKREICQERCLHEPDPVDLVDAGGLFGHVLRRPVYDAR